MVSHKPSIMAVCSLGVFLCKMRLLQSPVQLFQALCPFITVSKSFILKVRDPEFVAKELYLENKKSNISAFCFW
jgi:hypothetical protein